jgi:hypothetical protein
MGERPGDVFPQISGEGISGVAAEKVAYGGLKEFFFGSEPAFGDLTLRFSDEFIGQVHRQCAHEVLRRD